MVHAVHLSGQSRTCPLLITQHSGMISARTRLLDHCQDTVLQEHYENVCPSNHLGQAVLSQHRPVPRPKSLFNSIYVRSKQHDNSVMTAPASPKSRPSPVPQVPSIPRLITPYTPVTDLPVHLWHQLRAWPRPYLSGHSSQPYQDKYTQSLPQVSPSHGLKQ